VSGWLRSFLPALGGCCAFALVGWIVIAHWLPVSVGGGSMRPQLAPGDLAVIARTGRAQTGRVALVVTPRHGRVLHRVMSVAADGSIRTRGDANPVDDLDSLPASSVIGPVVFVAPFGHALDRWRALAACATIAAQQNSSKR
jgi:signal peptidase I